jgi:hypothetical protein
MVSGFYFGIKLQQKSAGLKKPVLFDVGGICKDINFRFVLAVGKTTQLQGCVSRVQPLCS